MKLFFRKHHEVFLAILNLLLAGPSFSQPGNFYIHNFSQSDYQSENYTASPFNLDIIADSRGILYVANQNNLLEFDGNYWRGVKSTEDIAYGRKCFAINSAGRIFVGGKDNLGYLSADSSGDIRFISLLPELKKSAFTINSAFCVHDTIYFISDSSVFQYSKHHFSMYQSDGEIEMATTIGSKLYCCIRNRGLFEFKKDHLQSISETQDFSSIEPVAIFPDSSGNYSSMFMIVGRNGMYQWDGHFITSLPSVSSLFSRINCAHQLTKNLIAIGTDSNGLIISDFSGTTLKTLNKTSGLNDNSVNNIYSDGQNGLWLALSNGISRIEFPTTLTYFNDKNGVTGIIFSLNQYDRQLFAGTYTGLFSMPLDKGQQFVKDNKIGPVLDILSIGNEVMLASVNGIFLQHGDTKRKVADGLSYQLYHTAQFPDYVFLATDTGVGVLQKINDGWRFMGVVNSIKTAVSRITCDDKGNLFAGRNKFFKIDFRNGVSLNPKVDSITISGNKHKDDLFYLFSYRNQIKIGGAYEGFYYYNSISNQFITDSILNKALGSPREVASPYVDSDNNLWFVSESRVGRILLKDGSYHWDTLPFMRMPKTAVWSFFRDPDHILWIGTNDGIYRYDESIPKKYDITYNTLLRNVKINGKTIFNGTFLNDSGIVSIHQNEKFKNEFAYFSNDIGFEFSAASFDSKEKPGYSYKLEGSKNHSWSDWSIENKKEYTNLHEGDYVFHVRARNGYGIISNEATFSFTVLPPWFRTWWAYVIYVILFFLLVYILIRINHNRLIQAKKQLEQTVQDRTQQLELKTNQLELAVNHLKDTQAQLVHSEKMASLGQLTSGIAHEINNPINFVSANINPLKRDLDEIMTLLEIYSDLNEHNYQSKLAEIANYRDEIGYKYTIDEINSLMKGIEEGSLRTAEIVKGLRNFSRLDEEGMKTSNINEGIESTLVLLQNKLKQRNIEVIKELGTIPHVECYPGQLNQVFMNLLTNAVDAINHDGKIFISTKEISTSNGFVQISVRDTGTGMTDEVKKKIFDPFFTTKEVGEGTGLGLSISYGIIEKHKGKVDVKTQVGKGTEFILTLPVQQSR